MSRALDEKLVAAVEGLMSLGDALGDVHHHDFQETYQTLLNRHVRDLEDIRGAVVAVDPTLQKLVCPKDMIKKVDEGVSEPDTWKSLREVKRDLAASVVPKDKMMGDFADALQQGLDARESP